MTSQDCGQNPYCRSLQLIRSNMSSVASIRGMLYFFYKQDVRSGHLGEDQHVQPVELLEDLVWLAQVSVIDMDARESKDHREKSDTPIQQN